MGDRCRGSCLSRQGSVVHQVCCLSLAYYLGQVCLPVDFQTLDDRLLLVAPESRAECLDVPVCWGDCLLPGGWEARFPVGFLHRGGSANQGDLHRQVDLVGQADYQDPESLGG